MLLWKRHWQSNQIEFQTYQNRKTTISLCRRWRHVAASVHANFSIWPTHVRIPYSRISNLLACCDRIVAIFQHPDYYVIIFNDFTHAHAPYKFLPPIDLFWWDSTASRASMRKRRKIIPEKSTRYVVSRDILENGWQWTRAQRHRSSWAPKSSRAFRGCCNFKFGFYLFDYFLLATLKCLPVFGDFSNH